MVWRQICSVGPRKLAEQSASSRGERRRGKQPANDGSEPMSPLHSPDKTSKSAEVSRAFTNAEQIQSIWWLQEWEIY